MHIALIFKKQAKVKESELIEKGLAQFHHSIHDISGYDLLCDKDNKQYLHSSIIETENKEHCPGTMNIYFTHDRHGLTQDLKNDCLCSTCQVCQMKKKECKKHGLLISTQDLFHITWLALARYPRPNCL
jgi:hypothetical protein